jgi:hypothetical protein
MKCLLKLTLLPTLLVAYSHGLRAEEQQSQGYRFEQAVIRRITDQEKVDIPYTNEWDIPAEFNRQTARPISIKCIRWGNPIYLGDALRQRKIKEPFEMVLGFYEPETSSGLARLKALHHVVILPEVWSHYWGEIGLADIETLSAGIKNKPLAQAQSYASRMARQLRDKPGIIDLNPKVNKDQRRIQCSIPFERFYEDILKQKKEAQANLSLMGRSFPESFPLGVRSRR